MTAVCACLDVSAPLHVVWFVVGARLQADFIMHGSPNNLRITWQFFEKDFLATDAFQNPRNFSRFDELYFDHFNVRVSEVRPRCRRQ